MESLQAKKNLYLQVADSPMPKRFKKIYCEISGGCNLTCDFCPLTEKPRGMMKRDLFSKVVKQAAPLTERLYFHVMGEPLLHPDFNYFVNECAEHALPVHLVTNGVLISPEREEGLFNPIVQEVNISLQSFAGCYGEDADDSAYLQNIFSFIERAFVKRPDLHINLRLWNLNDFALVVDHNRLLLEKIYAYFGEKIPEFTVGVRHHGRSVRVKNNLFMNYSTRFTWPSMELPECRKYGYCIGTTTQVGIHSDGTLVPCCLDNNATIKLGNVNESTILEIMEQPRAKKMYDGLMDGVLHEPLCHRCEFGTRFRRKIKYRK